MKFCHLMGVVSLVGMSQHGVDHGGRIGGQGLAVSHDGRVVKFVGDEAMFVSPDPAAACAIGLGLCAVVDAHPLLDRAHGAVGTTRRSTPKSSVTGTPSFAAHAA